jgi:TRAP-type C4-dicarboxylate transport system permease large subunit
LNAGHRQLAEILNGITRNENILGGKFIRRSQMIRSMSQPLKVSIGRLIDRGMSAIDPLWFWMMMLLNVTVGRITPPFGYAMFAFRGAAQNVTMSELFQASWAFVGLFVVGMAILAALPWLAAWLPGFVSGAGQRGSGWP